MKISFGTVWVYLLAALTTLGYMFFVSFATTITIIRNGKMVALENPPSFVLVFGHYDYFFTWCVLAGFSLIGNMAWGYQRSKATNIPDPHALPLISHLSWIGAASLMHAMAWGFWRFLNPEMGF